MRGLGAAGFLQPAEGAARSELPGQRGRLPGNPEPGGRGRQDPNKGAAGRWVTWSGKGARLRQDPVSHVTTVPFSLTVSSSEAPVRKTVVLTRDNRARARAQPRTFMASALAATCEAQPPQGSPAPHPSICSSALGPSSRSCRRPSSCFCFCCLWGWGRGSGDAGVRAGVWARSVWGQETGSGRARGAWDGHMGLRGSGQGV